MAGMIDAALLHRCAPQVAVETLERIIAVESAGDTLAINVNGYGAVHVASIAEAVETAQSLISEGYSVDLGLMQINSRHLIDLNLTVKAIFEPCTNLKAGAKILQDAYRQALLSFGPGQRALQAALSIYNTGDPERGLTNGYVAQFYASHPFIARRAPARANPDTASSAVDQEKESPHGP